VQLVADSSRDGGKIPVRSVYFGGGTPSLAPIETLRRVLQAITATSGESPFVLADNAEISIEMDPGTFSKAKLQAVKDMGFNRISLGVQSFDDDMLESLGRVHRRQDVFDAVAMLKEVFGGDLNYSVDLISGLPGLSLAKWIETLQTAVHLDPRPQHLSLYDLQIESVRIYT
jgi:oxygen-independent coproporphyrinogen-3 oxidase